MRVRSARLLLCFGLATPAWAQEADSDGDGVPDRADQCPKDAEDKNGFKDDDGCPDKKLKSLQLEEPAPVAPAAPVTPVAPAAPVVTAPVVATPAKAVSQQCVGVVTGWGLTTSAVEVQCDDGKKLSAYTGQAMQPDGLELGARGTLSCTTQPGSSLCEMTTFVDVAGTTYVPDEGCFLTTAVTAARGEPDDGPTLTAFRRFRDGPLAGHPDVAVYRRIAPAIVRAVEARPDAASIWRVVDEDYLRPILADIEAGRNAEAHAGYRALVRDLAFATGAAPRAT